MCLPIGSMMALCELAQETHGQTHVGPIPQVPCVPIVQYLCTNQNQFDLFNSSLIAEFELR